MTKKKLTMDKLRKLHFDISNAQAAYEQTSADLSAAQETYDEYRTKFIDAYGDGEGHDKYGEVFTITSITKSKTSTSRSWKSIAEGFKDEIIQDLRVEVKDLIRQGKKKTALVFEILVSNIPDKFDDFIKNHTKSETKDVTTTTIETEEEEF